MLNGSENCLTRLQEEIVSLAKEKQVLILAHYYQTMDIQEVADIVGDSFELARRAQEAPNPVLCLCGVRFMAEGAKILSPEKTVLLPSPDAGCPMADMVSPEDVEEMRLKYPEAAVVCYVNSTAAVKAVSDVCCTSSSAVKIVRKLHQEEIIFIPDQNLGAYVAARVPEKKVHLFNGCCPIHHRVTVTDVERARTAHPESKLLVHPECVPEVVALADGVGSTAYILNTVQSAAEGESFIIGTETGVVERLRKTAPDKKAYLLRDGFICPNMKKTTLDDVLRCLKSFKETIELDQKEMEAARKSLTRMIEIG